LSATHDDLEAFLNANCKLLGGIQHLVDDLGKVRFGHGGAFKDAVGFALWLSVYDGEVIVVDELRCGAAFPTVRPKRLRANRCIDPNLIALPHTALTHKMQQ
jgi:hypothetical protein